MPRENETLDEKLERIDGALTLARKIVEALEVGETVETAKDADAAMADALEILQTLQGDLEA